MIVSITYFMMYAVTIYLIMVSVYLVRRSSSLIPVFPIIAMYYWSLFGVWYWIPMKLRGGRLHIEDELFTVNIDEFYFLSVLYYSLFIVVFTIYQCRLVNKKRVRNVHESDVSISYVQCINKLADSKKYNALVVILLVAFLYLWYHDLVTAFSTGRSAYQVSRWESSTGSVEYLSMFMGNLFVVLAIPILFATQRSIKRRWYMLMIAVHYGMNFLLGNRAVLLSSLALGIILYAEIQGTKKVFRIRNVVLGITGVFLIQLISIVRGLSIDAILTGDFSFGVDTVFESLAGSVEKFASQISMYGTLIKDVPFTYGTSVLFLISAFIPSFMGFERPERVYTHYIDHTVPSGADLGWTINHVTAWYINFGVIGIILGALLWGYTLGFLFKRRKQFLYMYGAALFSSSAISMIRDGGIECYKGALLLNTVIPMLIVWYCLKKYKKFKINNG